MPDNKEKEKKAITPASLVTALFGDNPKAIISAIQGRRARRLGKTKSEDKYKSRTIGSNAKGKAIVSDTVYKKEYLAKEKAKKAEAKKAEKADKKDKKEA